jgi:hypothetical protein
MDWDEYNAMKHVRDAESNHHNEYIGKMVGLIKMIVSLSTVLLSILASLYRSSENAVQMPFLLQFSLFLLLITVLLGITAVHNDVNLHKICIREIQKNVKESRTYVKAMEKLVFHHAEPSGLHRYADRLTIALFCSSLVSLTLFAVLNI